MPLKFNPTTSKLDLVGASGASWGGITGTLSAQTDLQAALNALLPLTGGALTGPLSIQSGGNVQTWYNSGGDPIAHIDTTIGAGSVIIPYSAPVGNLYLGQTQIGNGGINYTYDSSITSPYVAHDFLQVWNGYNASVVASITASGAALFASIAAPAYVTGDNGYVEVAMGFFSGLPGLYIHDTNGTSSDYMRGVKNNDTYILQTTWNGQTTFASYGGGVTPLIARGYFGGQSVDHFQIQSWGGVSGATGPVLSRFDLFGRLAGGSTSPTIAANAGAGTSPTIAITGSDLAGKISLTTGTLPTLSADVFTVTFTGAFDATPYVVFSPANSATAALSGLGMVYVTATTTTFKFTVGATALGAATAYAWNYEVIG